MDTTAMMDINFMSNTSEIKAIYTVLILVCLSFCLSFCLWLPADFWAIENVEECQDFIWWIMKKEWPGKFKVINQVQGQTEHQNVN